MPFGLLTWIKRTYTLLTLTVSDLKLQYTSVLLKSVYMSSEEQEASCVLSLEVNILLNIANQTF